MLATLVVKPFDKAGWVFEEKYDGDRILACKEGDRVRLLSRNGKDRTEGFSRIATTIATLPSRTLLLDGEVVEARSRKWLKVKARQEDEFVICGHTKPAGKRRYFGALLLGAYAAGGKLRYVGKVGTGFGEATLAALHRQFQPLVRSKSALVDSPREKGVVFAAPKLVAQISFQEWTEDGKLRQPVFLGLREDKNPRDVLMPRL